MISFSANDRSRVQREMAQDIFDLVIIGGGINGAGVARSAALRGMKVALIEANDFASGTSSRSSKLVHGGIRYLENFEFKLVFEALSERQKLFAIAPNLVHPLRFMIPIYKHGRVGMFKMGLGMWFYDLLALFRAPKLHERLNPKKTKERMPSLQSDQLSGSYIYSDAYMDDDRLVLETLRSAVQAGARAVNYSKCESVKTLENGLHEVTARDALTGAEFKIRGHHLVSSLGPWTDLFGDRLEQNWKPILRPTKGVHLTFLRSRLPMSSAVVMGAEDRIVFAIPRHEMVIVGTTDTDFKGDPSQVHADPEDIRYLMGVLDQYFPGAKIQHSDIVASYAGVRPLVADTASTEGKTSREHHIFTTPHRCTVVAGGKYTTYRLISQEVVDECLKFFPEKERELWAQDQSDGPLNPLVTEETQRFLETDVKEVRAQTGWSESEASVFTERHGGEAREIVNQFGARWLSIELEALQAIHQTMCVHLLDFFTRRVPLFLSQKDHGLEFIEAVSKIFARELNWSEDTRKQEIETYREYVREQRSWLAAQ